MPRPLHYFAVAGIVALATGALLCSPRDDRGTVPAPGDPKVTPIEEVLAHPERFQHRRVRVVGRVATGSYTRRRQDDGWVVSSRGFGMCTALACPPAPDGGKVCCNHCSNESALFSPDPRLAESIPPITLRGDGIGCDGMDCAPLKCNPVDGALLEVVGIVENLGAEGSSEVVSTLRVETYSAR